MKRGRKPQSHEPKKMVSMKLTLETIEKLMLLKTTYRHPQARIVEYLIHRAKTLPKELRYG